MKKASHLELLDREFDPAKAGLPVDVATLTQLRKRVGDGPLEHPGRVFFHVVIFCTSGEGLHEVDFTPIALRPGRVVHVHPGQVHRWRFARNYEGIILFFRNRDEFPDWSIGPRWADLGVTEQERARRLLDITFEQHDIDRPTPSRNRALNGALELLIVNLGLDRLSAGDAANLPRPYTELMAQFEGDRDWSRSVKDRASRLGYSARTLTRACHAATGRTAKEVIDNRILLEAQRLLVHHANTVEHIGRQLSFNEPSNFAKFFHRMTKENPEAWRKRQGV